MSSNKYKGVIGRDELGIWYRDRDGGIVFNWFMETIVGRMASWMFDISMPYTRFYEVERPE